MIKQKKKINSSREKIYRICSTSHLALISTTTGWQIDYHRFSLVEEKTVEIKHRCSVLRESHTNDRVAWPDETLLEREL